MKSPADLSKDTKTALLDCAEELFLTRGFERVSIREITEAAGSNVAAVNYHFNGKTNLYRDILARRMDAIAGEKISMLEQLVARSPETSLEELLNAYIRSYFDALKVSTDMDRLMQIIYREMGPDAIATDLVASRLVVPIHQALQAIILRIRPNIEPGHVSLCISSITGQILHFIRARDILKTLRAPEKNVTFIEDTIRHITQFSLRGIGSNDHA